MTADGIQPTKSKALLALFPDFNTLDANGPLETFRKSGMSKVFDVLIVSETEITTSVEGLQVKRHAAIDDKLSIAEFDLLIIPGGRTNTVLKTPDTDETSSAFLKLIKDFSDLPPTPGQYPRILLSICSGALFLGKLGVFDGLHCTTHYWYYSELNSYCKQAAAQSGSQAGSVIPARFVDTGPSQKTQIISAGGISCGIDAALHVVSIRVSEKEALETAELLDYAWRRTDGVVFGQNF